MRYLVFAIFSCFLLGCSTAIDGIDKSKLDKAMKLVDQIEMNDYKLVATNGTLILIMPKQIQSK